MPSSYLKKSLCTNTHCDSKHVLLPIVLIIKPTNQFGKYFDQQKTIKKAAIIQYFLHELFIMCSFYTSCALGTIENFFGLLCKKLQFIYIIYLDQHNYESW